MPVKEISQPGQSVSTQKSVGTQSAAKKTARKKPVLDGAGKDAGPIKITEHYRIPSNLFKFIPHDSAELYKIIPLEKKDTMLYVGAVDPTDLDARDALNFITAGQDLEYTVQKVEEKVFRLLLDQYADTNMGVEEALGQLENDEDSVLLGVDNDEDVGGASVGNVIQEEAPVIKLVSTILAQAVSKEASDIHIEPNEENATVRYRLDGVLQDQLQFSKKIHDSFVARIKILSNLRIDERRRPQDGRFSSRIKDNPVDFRVAVFPTVNGEKIVLRVLDKQKGLRTLADVGFEEWAYERVLKTIKRPYGLILSTGPTGAGKTTTLYANFKYGGSQESEYHFFRGSG